MSVHNGALVVTAITTALLSSYYYYFHYCKNRQPKVWKKVGKVIKVHLYPLKSGRRIELKSAECTDVGLRVIGDGETFQLRDRSFVVYGSSNDECKTARTFPKTILIEITEDDETHLALKAPGMNKLSFKVPTSETHKSSKVKLGDESVIALDCGDEAARWVSRYIKGEDEGLRLAYHDASERRNINKVFPMDVKIFKNLRNTSTGLYSDLAAALLINQSSVDDLNKKIKGTKVAVENFRPNIVIKGDGAPPFAEDDWDWIKIGDSVFRNVRPCTRCVLTTVNPETGEFNKDREPLATLKEYRKLKDLKGIDHDGESPVMGINLEVYTKGRIQLNDEVFIA